MKKRTSRSEAQKIFDEHNLWVLVNLLTEEPEQAKPKRHKKKVLNKVKRKAA